MRAQNLGEGEGRRGRCPAPLWPSSPHLPPACPQRGLPHPTEKVRFVSQAPSPAAKAPCAQTQPSPSLPSPAAPLPHLPPTRAPPPARSRLARLAASVWALPSAWSTISAASPSDPRLSNTTPPLCSPNPPYSHSTSYHTLDFFIHSSTHLFTHLFTFSISRCFS